MSQEWRVSKEEEGMKLLAFLQAKLSLFSPLSARAVKKIVEQNRCFINNKLQRFASTPLMKGDRVLVNIEPFPSPSLTFEAHCVLYEDRCLLAYNKPAALTCDENGLERILREYSPSIQLIHRLDKDTTGVVLCAKDEKTLEYFISEFKKFRVWKSYLTLVEGVFLQKEGCIENHLGKVGAFAGQTLFGQVEAEQGLFARTDWKLIRNYQTTALLRCFPKTGRTHQIRVHMLQLGHPIVGDYQYRKTAVSSHLINRPLLHAEAIRFRHPLQGVDLQLEAPLPDDFKQFIQELV